MRNIPGSASSVELLTVTTANGRVGPPKGGEEPQDENNPLEVALREWREETDLSTDGLKFLCVDGELFHTEYRDRGGRCTWFFYARWYVNGQKSWQAQEDHLERNPVVAAEWIEMERCVALPKRLPKLCHCVEAIKSLFRDAGCAAPGGDRQSLTAIAPAMTNEMNILDLLAPAPANAAGNAGSPAESRSEPSSSAVHSEPEEWALYRTGEGRLWLHHTAQEWFFVDEPGEWCRCEKLDEHRRRWCHSVSGRWFFVYESQPHDIEREYECDWNVPGSASADSQDLAELRPDLEDVASTGG